VILLLFHLKTYYPDGKKESVFHPGKLPGAHLLF
jgi:hypothetical protein